MQLGGEAISEELFKMELIPPTQGAPRNLLREHLAQIPWHVRFRNRMRLRISRRIAALSRWLYMRARAIGTGQTVAEVLEDDAEWDQMLSEEEIAAVKRGLDDMESGRLVDFDLDKWEEVL